MPGERRIKRSREFFLFRASSSLFSRPLFWLLRKAISLSTSGVWPYRPSHSLRQTPRPWSRPCSSRCVLIFGLHLFSSLLNVVFRRFVELFPILFFSCCFNFNFVILQGSHSSHTDGKNNNKYSLWRWFSLFVMVESHSYERQCAAWQTTNYYILPNWKICS